MTEKNALMERISVATKGSSRRVMTILDGLQFREGKPESINSKTMATEAIAKSGRTFTLEETKKIEERFSSVCSSLYNKGKIKRTSKRINDGMFGYYTMQSIAPADTMEDRIAKADSVEQEQYKKLTSLKTIKELVPNLKDHELIQVMTHIGLVLEDRNNKLNDSNDDLTTRLQAAETKVTKYEEHILPLVEELDISTTSKQKQAPKPQLQSVG